MALDVIGVIWAIAFVIAGQIILCVVGRFLAKFTAYTKTTIDDKITRETGASAPSRYF